MVFSCAEFSSAFDKDEKINLFKHVFLIKVAIKGSSNEIGLFLSTQSNSLGLHWETLIHEKMQVLPHEGQKREKIKQKYN